MVLLGDLSGARDSISTQYRRINEMRYLKLVLICAVLSVLAGFTNAQAQTTVAVDIDKAKLTWNWAQGTGGTVDEFRVKCGGTAGTYTRITTIPGTARDIPVKTAITGSGNWFCAVSATNQFGESGNSNEVSFFAGALPSTPTNAAVVAQ